MAILKVVRRKTRFTQIDNQTARDDRLSFAARGLLVWLLSWPADWEFHRSQLVAASPASKDHVATLLSELESAGYRSRERVRTETGTFATLTTIYEVPALNTSDGER
jgi:hypothetical protein